VRRRSYTVRLLPSAEDDLTEIILFIAADNPIAAERILQRIQKNLSLLSSNPKLGRVSREELLARMGYRHLIVENYLIFYKTENRTIFVHRILDGVRDYLSLL
jgi:toxin ParE1/3/4